MTGWHWAIGSFLLGVAVTGFLAERKMRKLEREIQEHIGTEDKLRRYGT